MTENEKQTQQPAPATKQKPAKGGAPDFIKELQDKGFVVLTAQSRDELDKMVSEIPADVKYGAGAVGKNFETGVFTLRLDIV